MIIVDEALRRRAEAGNDVRVAVVGAGFMGRAIARRIVRSVPGMRLVGIANRTIEQAERAYAGAGIEDVLRVGDAAGTGDAIRRRRPVVTDDPEALTRADGIDAVLEVTGAVEYGAAVVLDGIRHGKHVVTMNAELDGTVGPILAVHARRAGVVLSGCDGDQPAVQVNLVRFVRGLGLVPRLCGNVKGLHDPYRTPDTQRAFAERWGQRPSMVTSFADGTKISFEQAIVANALGMTVARRGMYGHSHDGHVDAAAGLFGLEELERLGGIVDYLVGARPGPGVFVYATTDDDFDRHFLELYKLGTGPLYSFYTPYHLCHLEAPTSVARAVLFGDAAIQPAGPPRVEVIALAKRDLRAGEVLDGLGHFMTYGVCERAEEVRQGRLLPIGVAEGCVLRHEVARDQALRYDDVELPTGRLVDRLRVEQATL